MSLEAVYNISKELTKRKLLPSNDKLLSRDSFIAAVSQRFLGYCAFCREPLAYAHQIMDRRLFPDDGYYLGNGIGLCNKHYKLAQATLISVEELRAKAELEALLPPGLRADTTYDRWGNIIVNPTMIILGPLKKEPVMMRALTAARKTQFLHHVLLHEKLPVLSKEVTASVPMSLELEIHARRLAAARRKAARVSQTSQLDIVL